MSKHYNIENNDILFDKPHKKNNIYIANLVNKYNIKLPKLDILKTGKNNIDIYEIWYKIDLQTNEGEKLVKLLYTLDNHALTESTKNSVKWFGKELTREYLEESYIPPYDEDEEGNIYLKLNILNESLLKDFEQNHETEFEIEGLEFYRNRFKYSFIVTDVHIKSNFDIETTFDFIKSIESTSRNVNVEMNKVITNDVINDLADVESIKSKEDLQSRLSKIEIETIVNETRKEVKQYFLNADRASRAAYKLKQKAIEKSNELKKCEKLLENNY